MKNIKYILMFILTLGLTLGVSAEEIVEETTLEQKVLIIDSDILEVSLESNIGATGSLTGDVKLFETISIYDSNLDLDNKKVILDLDKELLTNYTYSILSIAPIDGAMDFSISGSLFEAQTIVNSNLIEGEEGIASINIVDPYKLEIVFTREVTDDIMEFNLLKEINVNTIESNNGDSLTLTTNTSLFENTNYILMFISLQAAELLNIDMGEGIYEFLTPENFNFEELSNLEVLESEVLTGDTIIYEESNLELTLDENLDSDLEEKPFLLSNLEINSINSLKVFFSNNLYDNGDLVESFKLFEHSDIYNFLDANTGSFVIDLQNKLTNNQEYLILGSNGVNGNFTFNIKEGVDFQGLIIENESLESEISHIEVLNASQLKLFLKDGMLVDSASFLFGKELVISEAFLLNPNEILLELKNMMMDNTLYTLLSLSLEGTQGEKLSIKDSVYDFTTEKFIIEEGIDDLNSAKEFEPIGENEEIYNVKDLAMKLDETPDTGTKETLLILLTLLLTSVIIFNKKRLS